MKIRLLFSLFSMMTLLNLNAQIETVGLIGSATPGGWDADTNMVQDPDSAHLWSLDISLITGAAKFRANDAWTINWGGDGFPFGIGTQDGPDILVPTGDYHITFNSNTGEYYFSIDSDIGIIGSATPFGWDADVNLTQSSTDTNEYSTVLTLTIGEAKFRQDDAWDINWGAADFPSGIGVQNGPNIPIPLGGDYVITFNKSTGAYNFQLASFASIGLIGDATPGGDIPTPLTQNPQNPTEWGVILNLVDGGVQFSGDNGVAVWGGTEFPSGTATLGGDPIPATAGGYLVTFNTVSLAYNFEPLEVYSTVGIIGDATPGGWDADTDMEFVPQSDSSGWALRIELTDGELKFRANDDWAVNWGAGDFPTGIALRDGPNIPITAGEYNITFNSFTGFYNFVLITVPDRVGLVGSGTPLMSWDIDFFLTQDPNDENVWTYPSIDLNGDVKFRADSMWAVNWGSLDFPIGVGVQDGPNIPAAAGTYGITFNSNTGEYIFGDPLSVKDLLDPAKVIAYPNPVSDELYLDITAANLRGEISLQVFDINGKLLISEKRISSDHMKLRVAALQNGYYTLHISNDKYVIGKKFIVAR